MTTTTRITALIRDHFCVDAVEPEHTLADLNADSLDIVELAMALEDAFHITIDDDEVELFGPDLPNGKTVADLVALVEGKVAGKVEAA